MNSSDPVNVAQANLAYPADRLDYVSTSFDGSDFDMQVESTGGGGSVKLVVATYTPISGDKLLATVTFKAKTASGNATVSVTSESMLVNAGNQIPTTKTGSVITIGTGSSSPAPKSSAKPSPSPASPSPAPAPQADEPAKTDDSAKAPSAAASTVTITLRVNDREGKPVSGATVKAGGKSYVTDANGTTDITVPVGKSTVELSKGSLKTTTVIAPGPEAGDNKDYTLTVVLASSHRGINWPLLAPFLITATFIGALFLANRIKSVYKSR
jgi:hypothetical protein